MTHPPTASSTAPHTPAQRSNVLHRILPAIAGALLGAGFCWTGSLFVFELVPIPPPPTGDSPIAHFMAAFVPTGYMTFVKWLELAGGLLVAVPRTRNLGLLVLGPILVNIVAFWVLVGGANGLLDPMLLAMCALAAFLLWSERSAFAGLVKRAGQRAPSAATTGR